MVPPPRSATADYAGSARHAIVTGGDSGIGRAVAIGFAEESADVVIVYHDEHEDAVQTVALVAREGRRCRAIAGDIGDSAFCRQASDEAAAFLGGIDILVNNAGEQHTCDDFVSIAESQMEATFRTNILGTMWMTQACLPHMGTGGAIVN